MDRARAGLTDEPALLQIRRAVRRWLRGHAPGGRVCVALSGGADSLALAAAAVPECTRRGGGVIALIVDHRLQSGSAAVAERAAGQARALGCTEARVLAVDVAGSGGMEAAARAARYDALGAARGERPVLFAHTLDDQAETVLLGLGRGSGARSIRGMDAWSDPWGRPLLGVRRSATRTACIESGLAPHEDPHNADPRFTRVRLRSEVLPLLEDVLGGGAAESLARTAAQLREDDAALAVLADALLARAAADGGADVRGVTTLDARVLETEAAAVRRRTLRRWLHGEGVTGLTDARLRRIDALVGDWRGQGGVAVGGGGPGVRVVAMRQHDRLTVMREAGAPTGADPK
ncbi:tRNA lysidine(34) synthetase TilS [Tomitella fengzijianii]|uniref:tRNA(Ile)-lysidine synthase n=1 Tax=Tomitella fengzijianii TaxID=2597660 RepID=A0A516X082_9ACTN|nr:tRNA lysidine(34) synthetase TilS [Tomitella fengzijianii]QDQ96485.1 tRNA lysidine(34) synthetase TilS [Tomitella fengzijianii]